MVKNNSNYTCKEILAEYTVARIAGSVSCKVSVASDYILKVAEKGRIGKKRKIARC